MGNPYRPLPSLDDSSCQSRHSRKRAPNTTNGQPCGLESDSGKESRQSFFKKVHTGRSCSTTNANAYRVSRFSRCFHLAHRSSPSISNNTRNIKNSLTSMTYAVYILIGAFATELTIPRLQVPTMRITHYLSQFQLAILLLTTHAPSTRSAYISLQVA